MELWQVFGGLLKQKGVKIIDVVNATKLPYTTVDSIIKKQLTDMKYSNAQKIADYFGVSVEFLATGKEYKEETNVSPIALPTNVIQIPVLGSIPAGVPLEAVQDILDWIDIPEEWTRGERQYFGLVVKGDSMFPEYLEGDTVVIRKQPCCDSGDDCAVIINATDATLKRVHLLEDGIELEAINPMYGRKKYTSQEIKALPLILLGIVVEQRRKRK